MQVRSNYDEGKAITDVCTFIYRASCVTATCLQANWEARRQGVVCLGTADGQELDIGRSTSVSVSIVWPFSLYLSVFRLNPPGPPRSPGSLVFALSALHPFCV